VAALSLTFGQFYQILACCKSQFVFMQNLSLRRFPLAIHLPPKAQFGLKMGRFVSRTSSDPLA
jgi:hypothetical protein